MKRVQMPVRCPEELKKALEVEAAREGRSRERHIVYILEKWMAGGKADRSSSARDVDGKSIVRSIERTEEGGFTALVRLSIAVKADGSIWEYDKLIRVALVEVDHR